MSDQDTTTDDVTDDAVTTTTDVTADTGDDTVTLTKAEADALRRQAKEGREAAKKAQRDAEKRARDKAEAEGKWKEIAEENERKATEAERKLTERDRTDRVTDAAKRLKFASPSLAHRLLDPDDLDDDQLTEAALKRVLKEHPELRQAEQRRTGTAIRTADGDVDEKDPMLGIAKQIHGAIHGG